GAGRGQRGAGDEQHAAPRGAAVLHARDDLLADVAALVKTDAAHLVEQHIVWKSIAQRIVRAAFGNARGDTKSVPGPEIGGGGLRRVGAPGRRLIREAAVAQPA